MFSVFLNVSLAHIYTCALYDDLQDEPKSTYLSNPIYRFVMT